MEGCRTIKDLVFGIIGQTNGLVDYETVTEAVRRHFPRSAWKESHWGYYRSQITSERGRYRDEFSEAIRANLRRESGRRGQPRKPATIVLSKNPVKAPEDGIKHIGDGILEHTRFVIGVAARNDARMRFKLRRWVYARLQQEEIREKWPVKQALWDSRIRACQRCGKKFSTIKGVEIHRKDPDQPYSVENCQLLCRDCHQKLRGRRAQA